MDFKSLKKFIELAKEHGASELSYETDDNKFHVSFQTTATISAPAPTVSAPVSARSAPSTAPVEDPSLHAVKSPFVGTFYTSKAPGRPAFVKPGDRVRKGQVLCILEAMKIMNEIESDVDGELVEICQENEALVEFGQPLFKIKV